MQNGDVCEPGVRAELYDAGFDAGKGSGGGGCMWESRESI